MEKAHISVFFTNDDEYHTITFSSWTSLQKYVNVQVAGMGVQIRAEKRRKTRSDKGKPRKAK